MNDWTNKSRGLFLCVVAAMFFSLWPVLDAISTEGCAKDVHASPYAFFVVFRVAAFIFTWMISGCLDGLTGSSGGGGGGGGSGSGGEAHSKVTFHNYIHEIPRRSRMLGLTAGFIWGCGTLCSLVSGEVVGLSVSVTMTRCSPLVATFWGVVVWGEAKGMNQKAKLYLGGMVVMMGQCETDGYHRLENRSTHAAYQPCQVEWSLLSSLLTGCTHFFYQQQQKDDRYCTSCDCNVLQPNHQHETTISIRHGWTTVLSLSPPSSPKTYSDIIEL